MGPIHCAIGPGLSRFRQRGHSGHVQPKAPMKRRRARAPSLPKILAAGLATFYFTFSAAADQLDQWYRRNPLPTSGRLYGVTYGNNSFVAVGDHGLILSSDGLNWSTRNSNTDALLNGVAFGADTFVAVGGSDDFGNATILTSNDGVTWTPAQSGTPGVLTAVAYTNGIFVAVGAGGLILTSTDASTWVPATAGMPIDFNGITHGSGNFVAVGGSEIRTSPDGVTWSMQHADTTNELYAVSFGGGQFVAAGAGVLLTSSNAANWTARDVGTNTVTLRGVAYGDGMATTVGILRTGSMTLTSAILTSNDFTNWT